MCMFTLKYRYVYYIFLWHIQRRSFNMQKEFLYWWHIEFLHKNIKYKKLIIILKRLTIFLTTNTQGSTSYIHFMLT